MKRAFSDLARKIADERSGIAADQPLQTATCSDLARRVIEGRVRAVFQFAGQGGRYLPELKRYFDSSEAVKRLVRKVSDALSGQAMDSQVRASGVVPCSLEPLSWAIGRDIPSERELACSPVSQPMIFLTQAASILVNREQGFPIEAEAALAATTGHSQGVMAALLLSQLLHGEEFEDVAVQYATWLFWQGFRMQEAARNGVQDSRHERFLKSLGEGSPSPMAAIAGLSHKALSSILDKLNADSAADAKAWISLRNGLDRNVVSAPIDTIIRLRALLGKRSDVKWAFLATSAPFHSPYMRPAMERFQDDLKRLGISVDPKCMNLPVIETARGENLQDSPDPTWTLVEDMYVNPVDWVAVCARLSRLGAAHVVDLGPDSQAAGLTARNLQGFEASVFAVANAENRESSYTRSAVTALPRPWRDLAPKSGLLGGQKVLSNRFTEFCGYEPIIGGGMTPTTGTPEIVAAAAAGGYIVELAGGAQVTREIFDARFRALKDLLPEGRGFVFNALYLDPYLWKLHTPLLVEYRKKGYPIIGVTISGGVPPKDEAVQRLREFFAAGIRLNSLKAGSDSEINRALEICDEFPDQTLVLQVEGGMAGGHHCMNDLEKLLDRNYQAIRARKNVLLAAGGGIDGPERVCELLSGNWAGKELAPRPVDAVLVGTSLMVAKEARTNEDVKAALVAAKGARTLLSFGEEAGGVVSGKSSLDADIYWLRNEAVKAAMEIASLLAAGRSPEKERDRIIALLAKTCKPYFGDPSAMTYAEVLKRMLELMMPGNLAEHLMPFGAWYDRSYFERFRTVAARVIERFAPEAATMQDRLSPENAAAWLDELLQKKSFLTRARLCGEDRDFFLAVCDGPGKPVNFVTTIDATVYRRLVSDCLWQAHDPHFPMDKVFVIPGPCALRAVKKSNRPVTEILAEHIGGCVLEARDGQLAHRRDGAGNKLSALEAQRRHPGFAIAHALLSSGDIVDRGLPRPNFIKAWFALSDSHKVSVQKNTLLFEAFTGETRVFAIRASAAGAEVEHAVPELSDALVLKASLQPEAPVPVTFPDLGADVSELYRSIWGRQRRFNPEALKGVLGDMSGDEPRLNSVFPTNWPHMIALLMDKLPAVDYTRLLHVRQDLWFEADGARTAKPGARIVAARSTDAGLSVTVEAWQGATRCRSEFFVRGVSADTRRLVKGEDKKPLEASAEPFARGSSLSPRRLAVRAFQAPSDTLAYATASGDFNPLHLSSPVAVMAGFDRPLVHGMWTLNRSMVEAEGWLAQYDETLSWCSAGFLAPVYPGDQLVLEILLAGFSGGGKKLLLKVSSDGRPVMEAQAICRAPRTAYLFTGQGSQFQGMGLAIAAKSKAAAEIWDRADAHLQQVYGFSIKKIVQDNPKTLRFRDTTVTHPKGILNLTQFTQVGLSIVALALDAYLKEQGLRTPDALFAGHSLGEYAALGSLGIIKPENLLEVVYWRGLTMQNYVPRDAAGRSPYGMSVVRPNMAGLDEAGLLALVDLVAGEAKGLLQVVNYNIPGRQYSVVGELGCLAELEKRLNTLCREQGKSPVIPIPGVDVPFHSRQLLPGVDAFREIIRKTLPERVDPAIIEGRYIPNLLGEVFELDKDFVKKTAALTGSPVLQAALASWSTVSKDREKLCADLLRELLAYQFASPVQWIKTQKTMLGDGIEPATRFVEFGPSPVLTNMLKQTVSLLGKDMQNPEIFHAEADLKGLTLEDLPEAELPKKEVVVANPAGQTTAAATKAAEVPVVQAPAGPASGNPEDRQITWLDRMQSMLAYKLGGARPAPSKSIEAICEGNSARRNELLADLKAEFSLAVDGAHTLSLEDLAKELAKGKGSASGAPGAFTKAAFDKLLPAKVGLNFQATVQKLQDCCGVSPRVAGDFILVSIPELMEYPGGDQAKGAQWLEAMMKQHLAKAGIILGAKGGEGGGGPKLSMEEVKKLLVGKDSAFSEAVDALMRFSGIDTTTQVQEVKAEAAPVADVKSLFDEANRLLEPVFDKKRVVGFLDAETWFKNDLFDYYVNNRTPDRAFLLRWKSFEGSKTVADMAGWLAKRYGAKKAPALKKNGVSSVLPELAARKPVAGLYVMKTDPSLGVRFRVDPASTKALFARKTETSLDSCATILVTGAGPGSIAEAMVGKLLLLGKKVIVTSSSVSYDRTVNWRKLYQQYAIRGAELWVIPANGGSTKDMDGVVRWCVENDRLPDLLLPFAAVPQVGYTGQVNPGRVFTAARVMLFGVEELLVGLAAAGRSQYANRKLLTGIPLSPNHGQFGGDGIYTELKLGLEALLFKARSEPLLAQTSLVCGLSIGWTRGTGLMAAHDPVAQGLERDCGIRTFSTDEMAALILHCLDSSVAVDDPTIFAIHGGIEGVQDLGKRVAALSRSARRDATAAAEAPTTRQRYNPLAWNPVPEPKLFRELADKAAAWKKAPTKVDDAIVVVGYGEVSPWGNSLTRWQMESSGELSLEGAVELAWMMGLIRYQNSDGVVGFVDAESGEAVPDWDIKARYEKRILEHSGVRFLEREAFGFDPMKVPVMATVLLERDLEFDPGDPQAARLFMDLNSAARLTLRDGRERVTLPKGSMVKVPKAMRLDRFVAGQLPTGWDPVRYGIPERIAKNADPVTLFNMAATAEAFLSMGMSPTELRRYVHPAYIANTQGSGMGGLKSIAQLFQNHREDRDSRGDILQETLINVISGWLVQDFVGSMGSSVNPVGACATAAVSVASAVDILQLGRADFVVAGGFDDLSVEGNLGFTWMQATAQTEDMLSKGIAARAHSRPNDSRRGGFVEGQGGATLLLSTFSKAVELGLPVYGIVAMAETHSDGYNTSIPAPGLGLLAMASDIPGKKVILASALERWGLGIDDLTVASKHDTSTGANDPNESKLLALVNRRLGRTPGNPLIVHSQKAMLGHAKGGASGPQSIAAMQMLQSGLVPGNPNLDDPDRAITGTYPELMLSDRTVSLPFVSSVMVTSLGFGHIGAAVLYVNPGFALKTLGKAGLESYLQKLDARRNQVAASWQDRLGGGKPAYLSGTDSRTCEELLLGKK